MLDIHFPYGRWLIKLTNIILMHWQFMIIKTYQQLLKVFYCLNSKIIFIYLYAKIKNVHSNTEESQNKKMKLILRKILLIMKL